MKHYNVEAQVLIEIEVEAENEEMARRKMREYLNDNSHNLDSWDWMVAAYEEWKEEKNYD